MTVMRANAMALLAALAWGIGNVSQKTILQHLDGFQASGIASMIGALVLLPLARREMLQTVQPQTRSLPLLLTVALLFTIAATLLQIAFGHTSVTNGGFLVNTAAVITPTIAWVFFRQKPPALIWVACLPALLGVYLMAGGHWTGLSYGDGLALLSALTYAVWSLFVGQYVMRYGRPIQLTVVSLAVCGLVCGVTGGALYGFPDKAAIAAALPELVLIGVVSKALAYVLMATAQQHISATSVTVLVSAESVFGAIAAMVFLGETLGPLRGVGALFIVLAVMIAAALPAPTALPGPIIDDRTLPRKRPKRVNY